MKFVKTLVATAALAASFAAGAQVVGSLGGGTGSFLALAGGATPSASPSSCTAASPCTLGSIATIVGGATLTGDAPFADANAFASSGGLFGGKFLAAGPTVGNNAALTFADAVNYVSFLWGSPDTYNTLSIVSSFGTQLFTAASIPGFTNVTGSQSFSQYVQFAGSGIKSLTFSNIPSTDAFETGNFSVTPVPEPETYALMLAGLGALGFISRRRRRD